MIFPGQQSGLSLYLRVPTGLTSSVTAALTEGSGAGLGFYHLDPTDLASLPAGTYQCKVQNDESAGTADPLFGVHTLYWDGDAELDGPLSAEINAIKVLTDRLLTMIELDGVGPNYQFTDDALENGPAGSGGTTTLDATFIDMSHTWRFETGDIVEASNVINEIVGFDGLLAMSSKKIIPDDVCIQSAELVEWYKEGDGTGGIVVNAGDTNLPLSPDRREVHVPVIVSEDDTYTLVILIETSDEQTFIRRGVIKAELTQPE